MGGPGAGEAQAPGTAESVMLDDLARALEQLRTPRITTVQLSRGAEPLAEAFVSRLAEAGYGVQRVDADQGAHHVSLERRALESASGSPLVRLELEVGTVTLARSYRVAGEAVQPASALAVGGTRREVGVDDTRFRATTDAELARVEYVGDVDALEQTPLISLITDEVVHGVAREASGAPSHAAVNSGRVEVTNLFHGDSGAFGALRETLELADRAIIVFANDSMRLGSDGKRLVERFAEGFREDSDMIGLIGCSNGKTALDIGNEGLALGRSRRVAEALVVLGIPPEAIIDEGCWAPVGAGDRFPSRGVVIEILRRGS